MQADEYMFSIIETVPYNVGIDTVMIVQKCHMFKKLFLLVRSKNEGLSNTQCQR